jgi:hypothetical protein
MPQLGTLLLGLALLVVVGLIIALPLFDRRRPAVQAPSRRVALETERGEIVRAIRELDFDHHTRKIDDADYTRLREDYVQRGAHVLRELSALNERDADEEIEQRVSVLRSAKPSQEAQTARICPSCGSIVGATDNFCGKCGRPLTA